MTSPENETDMSIRHLSVVFVRSTVGIFSPSAISSFTVLTYSANHSVVGIYEKLDIK